MSDRRLWLEEPCPGCGARAGLRCQTSRYRGKPTRLLHPARGWRYRSCPSCKAQPGELCHTPTGRRAAEPHSARLWYGRRELFADEHVWAELERWGAVVALVRFSGGGGSHGNVAAVTLEAAEKSELARWGHGEGELPEALAAPIWGRYALFRGHPRITAMVMWAVRERQVLVAGERGSERFEDVLIPSPLSWVTVTLPSSSSLRDTSPEYSAPAQQDASPSAGGAELAGSCARCGQSLPAGSRPEARYCSKRCRQAASRERLRDRPASPPPSPPEKCGWCEGPMPEGLRAEARFCSKRCRQASSRHTLRARRRSSAGSGPDETPAATAAPTAKARIRG